MKIPPRFITSEEVLFTLRQPNKAGQTVLRGIIESGTAGGYYYISIDRPDIGPLSTSCFYIKEKHVMKLTPLTELLYI